MAMEGVEPTHTTADESRREKPSVSVNKPIPHTFDLGNLTVFDENLLPSSTSDRPTNEEIASISRDCAQALINQLLTTCTILHNTKDGTTIKLPPPTTLLPREKPLPAEKGQTKWEKFAKKKGIGLGKNKEENRKMVYDEATGEWVPKWGYKGKNKDGDNQWLVEVDEKKEKGLKDGETLRGLGRRERVENVKRNDRKQRANERRARKEGA